MAANSYAPIIDKTANTGRKDIYLSHDGLDPITALSVNIQQYGLGTGFGYGGDNNAADDFADILALGAASGVSRNNADGLSGGVWIDMQSDVSNALQFDRATRPALIKVFGDGGTLGDSLANAIPILTDAMVYNDAGEQKASVPVEGQIGPAGNTVLGDAAHIRQRVYIPNSFLKAGFFQFEEVYNYAFTG